MNITKELWNKRLIILALIISTLPFAYLLFDNKVLPDFWYRLGNVSGFIGGVLILWQFILGIKEVSRRITSDYGWSLKLHIFLGVNGAFFVFLHPILEAISYGKNLLWIFQFDYSDNFATGISIGRQALFLFLLIWISSSLARNLLSYRVWLYIHYLSYPMLFFALVHPFQIGSIILTYNWVYNYWVFIGILFLSFVAIRLIEVLNIKSNRYKLLEKKEFPGGTFTYKFSPLDKKLTCIPGQYFFIKKNLFGEAHPFSVLDYDPVSGDLTFGVKVFGKFTKKMSEMVEGTEVVISGPFGTFTHEGHNADPKVILAGGIGVTPFYPLVKKYGNEKTFMINANQKLEFALYRDEFKKLLGYRYFDCIANEEISEKNVYFGVVTCDLLQKNLPKDIYTTGRFFICGPAGFMKAMINNLLTLGVKTSQIYTEEFGY